MHVYKLVMLPINLSCFLKCQCSNAFTVHCVQSMVPYLMDMAKLQWSLWWGAGGRGRVGFTDDDGDAHWKVRIYLLKESRGFTKN